MNKRIKVIAGAAVVGLVAAGGAFAYWSASGTGTGTAATGNTVGLTINSTPVAGLIPGGTPQVLSGTFDNLNAGPITIGGVFASIGTVSPAACSPTNFVIAGTATFTASVPAGTAVGSWTGQTIQLKDTGVLQDECKGVTVALAYSTTAPVTGPATLVGNVLTVNYTNAALSGAMVSVFMPDAAGALVGPLGGTFFQSATGTIQFSTTVSGITFVPGQVYNVVIRQYINATGNLATIPVTAS